MNPFREIERRRGRARSSYRDIKKHYVRARGWLPVFQRYAHERQLAVRYFTLCAKDAIDVRYFRSKGVLEYDEEQRIYPTVTFIEKDAQDYAVIAETLGTTRLGIKGDLEEILLYPSRHPENFEKLRSSFPYDVMNLDFTGEVVRADDPPYSSTIRAIEAVIELQHRANATRWHMFLTFRACPETSNHEADGELCAIVEQNLQKAKPREAYGARQLPRDLIRLRYAEFLRIGIAKLLASSAPNRGFASSLESSYVYRRTPGGGDPNYHIVKLIVAFSPIRAAANLPNFQRAFDAYENSVPEIFRSEAIDVYGRLGDGAERRRIQRDLQPVLEELRRQRIVE